MWQTKRVCLAVGLVFIVFLSYLNFGRPHKHLLWGPKQRYGNDLLNDINNSSFGFQHIFVVGLPERTDRRDGMVLGAALSNIDIDFIDGVKGTDVPEKAVPTSQDHEHLQGAALGSWRAHMNAIQEVVRRNLTSALILEDDVDWDVRIRDQLRDFAIASRALTQPLATNSDLSPYTDAVSPSQDKHTPLSSHELDFDDLPITIAPVISPYGDDWDVLWIGHCGMRLPLEDSLSIPQVRVIRRDDETVADRIHLWSLSKPFDLVDRYPPHTRAVHHTRDGVCSLGYAISQRGARRLLLEVGLEDVSEAFDILLRFFCEGTKGRHSHTCLTTQPGFFHHFRPAGPVRSESDISNHGDGWKDKSATDMVRWSVRLNADAILDGEMVFHDQYPDSDVGS